MKHKNTYKLTEGAILLAIFTVLLLLTLYIPGLGLVVNFFLALPFMMFAAKYDNKSVVIFTIAAVLLSLIFGTFLAIPFTLLYGLTGAIMGIFIRKEKSRLAVFVAGSLTFLVNTVIQYAASVVLFNINMIEEFIVTFRESIRTSMDMLQNMGQSVDRTMIEQMEASITLMETLMPSMFVIASFFIVFIVQLVSFPVLRRFGIAIKTWPPFRDLLLPKSLLWYYLIALFASLFMQPDPGSYWYWALTNLLFVLQFFMMLQGFSFIAYFLHAKGVSRAIFILIIILAVFIPFVLYIVRILGIIDLGFDLRKRLFDKK
ncbi:YybS family protein [Bacillus sp. B15-48]|uniref:YybS family protein n=1 Tax=Bacillus sp. B15-48 TaxID=1548601 RepID=UPI00193FBB08|nr:YybS family protein [Bacillus sp. B15-48]MBM4761711.1 DUF2232 domain-containing protein [Bacillus sp. B15-48]